MCGEPTFQIRIVVPVCACGVTTSSAANAVHANVRNMLASVVQLDDSGARRLAFKWGRAHDQAVEIETAHGAAGAVASECAESDHVGLTADRGLTI